MSALDQIVSKSLAAAHGSYGVLSTGERLAAALVLNRPDWLELEGYTLAQCIDRVGTQWMREIPEAARKVSQVLQLANAAIESATLGSKIDELNRTAQSAEDPVHFNVSLRTCGHAPGYRSISFEFDMIELRSSKPIRAQLQVRAEDTASIMEHIRSVHRFAWRNGRPIDVRPGEQPPPWL